MIGLSQELREMRSVREDSVTLTDRRDAELDEYHQEQWPMLKASILVRVL